MAQVYDTVLNKDSDKKTAKIVKKLGLDVPARLLRGTVSHRTVQSLVLTAYLFPHAEPCVAVAVAVAVAVVVCVLTGCHCQASSSDAGMATTAHEHPKHGRAATSEPIRGWKRSHRPAVARRHVPQHHASACR